MSDSDTSARDTLWFRLGYALEKTRHGDPAERLRGLARRRLDAERARRADRKDEAPSAESPGTDVARSNGRGGGMDEALEALIAAGAGTLVGRILGLWKPRREAGMGGLIRGAAAGAAAALLRKLVHPLLHGEVRAPELDDALAETLMAGAARGLLYASIVEPRLPGPSLARGALFGAVEYAVSPWGGLTGILGNHAPHHRVPVLAGLFEEYEGEDDTLVDHLAFAVALSLLYGGDDGREVEVVEVVDR